MNIPRALSEFEPSAITDKIVRLGEDWVDKKHAARLLESNVDTLYSQLFLQYKSGGKVTVEEAKHMAQSDSKYVDFVTAMLAAKREEGMTEVRYNAALTKVEIMRSVESTRRSEMNLR